jgi:hypothetical protein
MADPRIIYAWARTVQITSGDHSAAVGSNPEHWRLRRELDALCACATRLAEAAEEARDRGQVVSLLERRRKARHG